jgi:hypothetical protein
MFGKILKKVVKQAGRNIKSVGKLAESNVRSAKKLVKGDVKGAVSQAVSGAKNAVGAAKDSVKSTRSIGRDVFRASPASRLLGGKKRGMTMAQLDKMRAERGMGAAIPREAMGEVASAAEKYNEA